MSDMFSGGTATQETAAAVPSGEPNPTSGRGEVGGEQAADTGSQESAWWEGKNFDEAPPFQNLKSTYDRKMGELSRNYTAAQQTLYDTQRRMQQMEQAIEQQQLSGKDDYEKLEHYYKKELQKSQYLEQQLNAVTQEISRQNYINAIKDEFGVDLSGKQFQTPDEAMVLVARMQREKAAEFEKKVQQLERKAGALDAAKQEAPDLGGGGTPIGKSALQRQYDEYMIGNQGDAADKIARQAKSEGIAIDRFSWIKQRKVDG